MTKLRSYRNWLGLAAGAAAFTGVLLGSCGRVTLPDDVQAAMQKLPEKVDYTYQVKPILSDRCFACHGPDKNKQQAGLRLDIAESAYQHESDESGRNAIVRGNPGASELVRRILATDPKVMMPTPESHLSLTAEEKATLIKWIDQGAEYKPHWAFVTPEKPALPQVKNTGWVRNDIDRFVLKKLEDKGLTPSKEADKTTLLRRVSFDLTGLPPTLAEVDAFLKDTSPSAYEKAVDRLLASPHFGEHLAVSWLDAARYADTHGYQDDGLRTMWPFRDWVIKAFNQNLPYDKFTTWQLAGDLLPHPTKDMLLATAFNRNHQQSQEGGIVPQEYQNEYIVDRVGTFGKTFLGLTVECARCHDHKYDAITQKDFYSLYAFFNTNNEYGQIPYNGEPSPHVTLPTPEAEAKLNFIKNRLRQLDSQGVADQAAARARFQAWLASAEKTPEAALLAPNQDLVVGISFDKMAEKTSVIPPDKNKKPAEPGVKKDRKALAAKPEKKTKTEYFFANAANDTLPMFVRGDLDHKPPVVPGRVGNALSLAGEGYVELKGLPGWKGDADLLGRTAGWFERHQPFTVGIWVRITDPKLAGPLFNRSGGPFNGFRGYECIRLDDGRLAFRLNYVWPDDAIDVETTQKIPLNQWTHVAMSYDGTSRASGLRIFLNGRPAPVRVMTDNLTQSMIWGKEKSGWGAGASNFAIGQRHDYNYRGYAVDELNVFGRKLTPLEIGRLYDGRDDVLAALQTPVTRRTPEQNSALLDYYLTNFDQPTQARVAARRQEVVAETALLNTQIDVMVMHEQRYPRQTHLLKRGAYDAPGELVKANTPSAFGPMPAKFPRNRLGLAEWLVSPENPIFARVVVNRFWQQFFGNGLVKTSDDFGNQGELPTHPELLDYLAVGLRESGWNVKNTLRQIVLSATYRQSSQISEKLHELDPDNRLLARGPSYRMSAEQVRDNALCSSGLLTQKVGGPSVHPYQPAGIWEALATRNAVTYVQNHGDSLYRRSLYTIWKRSSPPPMMLNFDAAERHSCTVKRQKTSTPLQALVTLNDPQFVEAARVLAQQMMREGGPTPESRITLAYKALTSRPPRPQEIRILKQLYAEELADFQKNPKRAAELLKVGEFKRDPALNPAELAANAIVASTVMNFDEFLIKR